MRDQGLARAGGQHDDPPPAGLGPRVEGCLLVVPRRVERRSRQVQLGVALGVVGKGDLLADQEPPSIGIGYETVIARARGLR